ncbi:MAG: hypothetical protein FWF96_05875 [Kiritimatiellaeota bacterium]|nr:hypothetical protein [Kiritimatiellota bacterium]
MKNLLPICAIAAACVLAAGCETFQDMAGPMAKDFVAEEVNDALGGGFLGELVGDWAGDIVEEAITP